MVRVFSCPVDAFSRICPLPKAKYYYFFIVVHVIWEHLVFSTLLYISFCCCCFSSLFVASRIKEKQMANCCVCFTRFPWTAPLLLRHFFWKRGPVITTTDATRAAILFLQIHILFTATWYLNLWDIRKALRIRNSATNATNTINTHNKMCLGQPESLFLHDEQIKRNLQMRAIVIQFVILSVSFETFFT